MQHRCTICRCTEQDSLENNLSIAAGTGNSPEVNMKVKLKGPILNELMFLAFRDTVCLSVSFIILGFIIAFV